MVGILKVVILLSSKQQAEKFNRTSDTGMDTAADSAGGMFDFNSGGSGDVGGVGRYTRVHTA
jgi:hypothetical protein